MRASAAMGRFGATDYRSVISQDLPRTRSRAPAGDRTCRPVADYAESEVPRAQEVWKLSGAGSVGGQALTGIPALEGLRRRTGARIWPFETLGEGRRHVLAEIYPSLIEPCPGPEVLDARQVEAVAEASSWSWTGQDELEQSLARAEFEMPARCTQ